MFVLSVIRPPKGGNPGQETTSDPIAEGKLFTAVYWAIRGHDSWLHPEVANKCAGQIVGTALGEEILEPNTGLRFRIDKAEDAPKEG